MFVVQMPNGKFVYKEGGINYFYDKPIDATRYATKDDAQSGKVGQHRDMGGSGFIGRIVTYSSVEWLNGKE